MYYLTLYYVALYYREVKKRYDWVHAEDIKHRLEKLRHLQENAKLAEKKIGMTESLVIFYLIITSYITTV